MSRSTLPRRAAAAAPGDRPGRRPSLAACGGDDDGGGGGGGGDADTMTVWISEDLPDRVAATQKIVDAFTEESGVEVKLTAGRRGPVRPDPHLQRRGRRPARRHRRHPARPGAHAVGQRAPRHRRHRPRSSRTSTPATFSESALELTADGDTQLAIPSESWIQLLVYRKDLFEAGRASPSPTTYDDILAAAEALDSPDLAGFVGANIAGDAFTAQTFEEIGLGNDCQLVDEEGEVTFDSDQCVEALDFYGQLMQNYTVSGAQDVDTTRASYFAGQAAMIIWSTFILDEMAGLRNDALPTCPECKNDPAFLAKNSGVVTAIQGPSGSEPAHLRRDHLVDDRRRVGDRPGRGVRRVHDDRRLRAVDRHRPRGQGAGALRPRVRLDGVRRRLGRMDVGVDTKAPLSDFYGQDVIDALTAGTDTLPAGRSRRARATCSARSRASSRWPTRSTRSASGTDPAEAASQAADAIREAAESLE